jgi:hypothetical protein
LDQKEASDADGITKHTWVVLASASAWKTLPTTITNTDACGSPQASIASVSLFVVGRFAALVVHENRQQNNNRQRNSDQPK